MQYPSCNKFFNRKPIPVSPNVITKDQVRLKIIEVGRELSKTDDPYQKGRIEGKLYMLYEQLDEISPLIEIEYKTGISKKHNPLMLVCNSAKSCKYTGECGRRLPHAQRRSCGNDCPFDDEGGVLGSKCVPVEA